MLLRFAHLLAKFCAIHDDLLGPSQKVADGPVNSQARRQVPTDDAQHHRHHDGEHFLLGRVHARLGCALLRKEHGNHNRHRQKMERIGRRKIMDPQPVCLPQLNRVSQHGVKGNQKRHLQKQRKATANGINACLLVKSRHLFLHFRAPWIGHAVPAILFCNGLHLRLDLLHLHGRLDTRDAQGQQHQRNDYGQEGDGPSPVRNQVFVGPLEAQK